jgi:hypothetical protein
MTTYATVKAKGLEETHLRSVRQTLATARRSLDGKYVLLKWDCIEIPTELGSRVVATYDHAGILKVLNSHPNWLHQNIALTKKSFFAKHKKKVAAVAAAAAAAGSLLYYFS